MIPRSQVVAVVIIVDRQYYSVKEDEQDDEILEEVRACKVHQLLPENVLVMQTVQRSAVVHDDFWLFLSFFFRAASEADQFRVHIEYSFNEVGCWVYPFVFYVLLVFFFCFTNVYTVNDLVQDFF